MGKIQTTLRIDEELHEELLRLAEDEDRSLNSQMIMLLKIGKDNYRPSYQKRGRPKKTD